MSLQKNQAQPGRTSNLVILLGVTVIVFFFVASGVVSYRNTRTLNQDAQAIQYSHEIMAAVNDLMSTMKDAETGQRGFLLTGDERYLEPYSNALPHIDDLFNTMERLTSGNPREAAHLHEVKPHIEAKLAELNETIILRRTKSFRDARDVVITDRGKNEMDAVRAQITAIQREEAETRARQIAEMGSAYHLAVLSGLLAGILGTLLSAIVAYMIWRTLKTGRREEWLQSGQVGMGAAVTGELRLEKLGENVLKFLADYFDAQAGAFYTQSFGSFHRVASYGVPAGSIPETIESGDRLLGQAIKDNRVLLVQDIPGDYLTVGSALGQSKPRHLIIAPMAVNGTVNAVMELGFMRPVAPVMLDLLSRIADLIGTAVQSANYRANLQNLLEETQRQAEELQTQSEELRVANEELEEQSRAIKASQVSLEQQQAELEQTNSQLEEQTQLLERQKDDVERAKEAVQIKAQELEQASRYKSDFLANMSHELRTPLNSSLILAKLLADNPAGNLTEEQVKYARTIQSSGNDLLTLINDILDLSKIEAAHMDVRPEEVSLFRLSKDLTRVFQPLAEQKKLSFHIRIDPTCPKKIQTDRQRLEQVLKNLVSNAIKFTETGKVELSIACPDKGMIAFAVTDTGIGIPAEHQATIFEAFRQADSTISRKYGGTGLGLSISRQLIRLLGGSIALDSAPGEGSTFTITIPITYSTVGEQPALPQGKIPPMPAPPAAQKLSRPVEDDRENLTADARILLVIEDDEPFAHILYQLAHELNFQCLIAATADDALIAIKQYQPSAIVLDIGLPDHSGLSVLDWLKRNIRTRHIPVHVISAGDYTETALSLGAVGYMMKPVKRKDLSEALRRLEVKLEHRMRRVLIVEDDAVQRDSVARLLQTGEVETVAVGTAAECLEQLKTSTFDCMVLDLSLPDSSGYALLETLSQQEAYAFPPVIVYTGRTISADEEQRLRRYSKSIIIKGANAPERLLDEVSLFLHQVVSELPPEQQKLLEKARNRDTVLENKRILIVEDDMRNVYALTSLFEPHGVLVQIARNGREALTALDKAAGDPEKAIDMVLMDVMMPEMDGLTATREIRKQEAWKKLPIIMLTAKAMKDDQERCIAAGASDYMAKPLDVEKLLSLVRVWMPR